MSAPTATEFLADEFAANDMGTDIWGCCRNCNFTGEVFDKYGDPEPCGYCGGKGHRPIDTDTADLYDARQAAKRRPVEPSPGNFDPWALAAYDAAVWGPNPTMPGGDHDEVPF